MGLTVSDKNVANEL